MYCPRIVVIHAQKGQRRTCKFARSTAETRRERERRQQTRGHCGGTRRGGFVRRRHADRETAAHAMARGCSRRLLYLGSGIGLTLYRLVTRAPSRASAEQRSVPWFAGAIAGRRNHRPVLLMFGLTGMPASGASLLLNAEAVFTALLAWFAFKENFDRRIALGMVLIVLGAIALAWPGEAPLRRAVADARDTRRVLCVGRRQQPDTQGVARRRDVDRFDQGTGSRRGQSAAGAVAWRSDSADGGAGWRDAGRVLRLRREPGAVRRCSAASGRRAHRRVLFGGAVLRRGARAVARRSADPAVARRPAR